MPLLLDRYFPPCLGPRQKQQQLRIFGIGVDISFCGVRSLLIVAGREVLRDLGLRVRTVAAEASSSRALAA